MKEESYFRGGLKLYSDILVITSHLLSAGSAMLPSSAVREIIFMTETHKDDPKHCKYYWEKSSGTFLVKLCLLIFHSSSSRLTKVSCCRRICGTNKSRVY